MASTDFAYATATQLSRHLADGDVSSVELTNAAIARIERLDGAINAVCVRDFDNARIAASQADAARAAGETAPLLGIPLFAKELFNVAGLPTTWGIAPFKDFVASEDAVPVARVRKAGAVVLGKTNVPLGLGDLQSYNAIYGTTNNPWAKDRTPGGSSGGSAAALAAGYAPLSIGSDIAGSLRVPAHFCGIYAHKPSYGILASRGHTPPPARAIPLDRDLAVIGPMARSASDLSLLFDVLLGPDEMALGKAFQLALPKRRHDRLADYRVLVLDTHPAIATAASVRTAIDALVETLEKAGAEVHRESPLLPDLAAASGVYMRLLLSTIGSTYPDEIYDAVQEQAKQLSSDDHSLSAERTRGIVLSHRDWLSADIERAVLRLKWQGVFERYDIVVCPVSPTPAFPHDQSPVQWTRKIAIDGVDYDYPDQLVWSGLASAPGLPATAIPVAKDGQGLPIGVQLIGAMYEDLTTLHFAGLVEAELGGFTPPTL